MQRIALFVFSLLLGLICINSPALSTEVTIFGPEQYLRTTGSPDLYTDTFSGVTGGGRIVIKNGNNESGKKVEGGVSSATVNVNGVEIFSRMISINRFIF